MLEKIKAILFQPKETWPKIKADGENFGEVLTRYAVPLAAIPAFFGLLGHSIFFRIFFGFSLIWAIVYYILILIGLYVEGIVINALAPSFGSRQDSTDAFKLAVYAYTPVFVAGILNIFPMLGILAFLISLYGLYLLYLGLPVMMETPKEKVIGYLVVTIIVLIIIYFIIGAISTAILSIFWRPLF